MSTAGRWERLGRESAQGGWRLSGVEVFVTRPAHAAPARRVAMVSMHTSPLDQPGAGDAGGMNVYVTQLSRALAERGVEVEIFTRATSGDQPPAVALWPGVTVRHIQAGPYGRPHTAGLAAEVGTFAAGVLRAGVARGYYGLVHSHYWLSGQAGRLVARRWGVPLVHSMHTLAKVKNARRADGDLVEPRVRTTGEEEVVASADRLVAGTAVEAAQLRGLYAADPGRVAIVHPGVDLDLFRPGDRHLARSGLGVPAGRTVLLYAGRIQPLKAPDMLIRAAATMVEHDPELRERLMVVVIGGLSGTARSAGYDLPRLARELKVDDVVRFEPAQSQQRLASWYRAADLTVVPSRSESFGLVALESQACGTPVVASAVGGLSTAVLDGRSGVLVEGHEPDRWAGVIRALLADRRRHDLGRGGVAHARTLGWDATAGRMLDVYDAAREEQLARAIVA